ncbi:MAG: glutamine-hydrolyzing GMP synthase, partial [Desulfobacteraceae bacterium]
MILIIDFGSQFNQLIARRVREHNVYCQIEPPTINIDIIKTLAPKGIILSGGPSSVYEKNSPRIDTEIFNLGIPVLGICYGMHFMVNALGGIVKKASKREYGFASLCFENKSRLFKGVPQNTQTWMSHGDSIEQLPQGFVGIGYTDNTPLAAAVHDAKQLYAVQFHPEVEHTVEGKSIIGNFLFEICDCEQNWNMKSFAQKAIEEIKEQVGNHKVILGLSGGVDSSVTALLIHKAIGKNLTCIFVDNGLLRKNEAEDLKVRLKTHLNI